MKLPCARHAGGFTLVELLIVVALGVVLLTLAAPSFNEFILMQRLKGINAQLVTDIQYARSEAVSRNVPMHMKFQAATGGAQMSCYVMYTTTTDITSNAVANECDCTAAEGLRCVNPATEVRTVQVPVSSSVRVAILSGQASNFAFNPRTGGIQIGAVDTVPPDPSEFSVEAFIDAQRKLRDSVGLAGRVKVCIPTGSTVGGTAC